MAIDYDARKLAFQIIIIFFIVITIIVNAAYLCMYVRARKVLFRPGHLGKITVAIGSIFLSLFSYVVTAMIFFEDTSDLKCRSTLTAAVFEAYFFPFVVGFIICSSSLSIYLSQRQFQSARKAKLISFVMAVFPWLLALVVVCPLALAGTEWDRHCSQDFTYSRHRAILGISVLLPAIVAVLSTILLNCATSPSHLTSMNDPLVNNMTNLHATNVFPNTNVAMSTIIREGQQQGVMGTTQGSPWYPQSQQGFPQYPQQPPQYPQNYPPPYAQQYPQYHPQAIQQPGYVGGSPSTIDPDVSYNLTFQQAAREKRGLLWASLIFCFSVLPYTFFTLGYTLNDDPDTRRDLDESTAIILNDTFSWIFHIYPVFLPIFWKGQVKM